MNSETIMAKNIGNVYLDTNVLRQLDFELHNDPRFVNFRKKVIANHICMPKIVFDELVSFYQEILTVGLPRLKDNVQKLNKYIKSKININVGEGSLLIKEMHETIQENMKLAAIEVFDNPLDKQHFEEMLRMAAYKIKPFQSEGKGFKDAAILFSILEHCKKDLSSRHFFVTCNKNDFDHEEVKDLIKREKVDLSLFYSLEEVSEYFDDFMNAKLKEWMRRRKESLRSVLFSKKIEITEFIKKYGEFDSWDFTGYFGFGSSIEQIKEFDFLDIIEPEANFLEEGISQGDVELYFKAKVNFHLVIKKSDYESPKLKVGESSFKLAITPKLSSVLQEAEMQKDILIRGKIHVEDTGSGENFFPETLQLFEITRPNALSLALASSVLGQ